MCSILSGLGSSCIDETDFTLHILMRLSLVTKKRKTTSIRRSTVFTFDVLSSALISGQSLAMKTVARV